MKYKYIEHCRDGYYLISELSDKQLQEVENILAAYNHGKIDLIIPRFENDEVDYSNLDVNIIDNSYIQTGWELLVLKWYEDFEDTDYMVSVIKEEEEND